MSLPTLSPTSLRRITVVAALVLLMAGAVATYALSTRSDPTTPSSGVDQDETSILVTGTTSTDASPDRSSEVFSATTDPAAFTREVAAALFTWDTTSLVTRTDLIETLVTVADPTGESSPGLVSDLDGYLPSQSAWVQLAQYETRQWLEIESAVTPEAWAVAEAQAGDTLAPGTTAVTVRGVRHRAGLWEGEDVTSTHDVAFTVFVVCGPTYERCHLLRLSMLDHPLE